MKSSIRIKLTMVTFLACLFFISLESMAQEEESESQHEDHHKHLVSLFIGHSNVPAGVGDDGKKEWLILPSWGLDYNYRLSESWSLGLHTDWVVENFEVENHFESNEAVLNRQRPLAVVAVTSFKPKDHFVFLLGAGGEFSKEENLFLIRAGIEYSVEFSDSWDLAVSLLNDLKLDAYNSWFVGLGVGKAF